MLGLCKLVSRLAILSRTVGLHADQGGAFALDQCYEFYPNEKNYQPHAAVQFLLFSFAPNPAASRLRTTAPLSKPLV